MERLPDRLSEHADRFDTAYANAMQAAESTTWELVWSIGAYLTAFLLLALVAFRLDGRGRGGLVDFLRYVFPRRVYRNRSTLIDLKLLVANQLMAPGIALLGAGATAMVALAANDGLSALWPNWNPNLEWHLGEIVAFTVSLAIVADLATYVAHRLHHQVPWLWEFHKVHHSASVLSPLTIFRKHPVYDVISRSIDTLLMGPFQGVVFFLFAGPVGALTMLGTNFVFAAFYLLGGSLRHTHMWLSFGPVLSRIFISPAQHQIHHSAARKHWDKNFGELFAIWDWLFGTLYVPRGREQLTFGVAEMPAGEHATLLRAYLNPFRNAWRILAARMRRTA